MTDLLEISSSEEQIVENADWAEMSALLQDDGNVSQEDLARAITQARGIKQDTARQHAQDAFGELLERVDACIHADRNPKSAYPFTVSSDTRLLSLRSDLTNVVHSGTLYSFLLGITRAEMGSTHRKLANIDPTELFEQVSGHIPADFWGGPSTYSGVYVAGTSKQGGQRSFAQVIAELCDKLMEGRGWKDGARNPRGGDGGLDIAVWRRFSDGREGALVGFAQCKTGDHWRKSRTHLVPRAFCREFMKAPLIIDPMRIYMVPSRVDPSRWPEDVSKAGLLFDRCRLVQFGSSVPATVIADCKKWLDALIEKQKG